jgi:hypothetical protein
MVKGKFKAYTKDGDADQVRAAFEAKHGYRPDQVRDGGAVWLAGPLVEVVVIQSHDEDLENFFALSDLNGIAEQLALL